MSSVRASRAAEDVHTIVIRFEEIIEFLVFVLVDGEVAEVVRRCGTFEVLLAMELEGRLERLVERGRELEVTKIITGIVTLNEKIIIPKKAETKIPRRRVNERRGRHFVRELKAAAPTTLMKIK